MLACLALGACSSAPKCDDQDNAAYLKAQDRGALQVPEGVAQPDRGTVLTIPAQSPNAPKRAKNTCLDRVPAYFGTAGRLAASPEEMVADWAQAWADRNGEAVASMYSQQFTTDAPAGAAAFLAQRRDEVTSGPLPNGRLDNLKITSSGTDRQQATFVQRFGTNAVQKELTLIRENGVWKIVSERVVTVSTVSK